MTDLDAFVGQWGAIARRALYNAGQVAARAADQVDAGTFETDAWIKSATQLFDIAFLGSLELAETILAGPAQRASTLVSSDVFHVGGDNSSERSLALDAPLTRLGTADAVPNQCISFDPTDGRDADGNPRGLLVAGSSEFRIVVEAGHLPSAVYVSTVRVSVPNPAHQTDAQEFLVSVEIAL